jgi:hypothetical protein
MIDGTPLSSVARPAGPGRPDRPGLQSPPADQRRQSTASSRRGLYARARMAPSSAVFVWVGVGGGPDCVDNRLAMAGLGRRGGDGGGGAAAVWSGGGGGGGLVSRPMDSKDADATRVEQGEGEGGTRAHGKRFRGGAGEAEGAEVVGEPGRAKGSGGAVAICDSTPCAEGVKPPVHRGGMTFRPPSKWVYQEPMRGWNHLQRRSAAKCARYYRSAPSPARFASFASGERLS